MIQITFQAALDPFHTVFRLFRLRAVLQADVRIEFDKIRILDFYLQFPFRLNEVQYVRKDMYLRKLAVKFENTRPYGNLPDSHVLFERMAPIQSAAMQSMAHEGYYDQSAFEDGMVLATAKETPGEIAERVREINEEQKELVDGLLVLAVDYDLFGSNGLKARSNLLEYRYDAV